MAKPRKVNRDYAEIYKKIGVIEDMIGVEFMAEDDVFLHHLLTVISEIDRHKNQGSPKIVVDALMELAHKLADDIIKMRNQLGREAIDMLVPQERTALQLLLRNLREDGTTNVVIKQLYLESKIIPNVFNNAIHKAILGHLLFVVPQGARGVYIKVLNRASLIESGLMPS